jgi:hypothetical protein
MWPLRVGLPVEVAPKYKRSIVGTVPLVSVATVPPFADDAKLFTWYAFAY